MPDQNRRQDFRIDDILPMQDEPLSKDAYETQSEQIGIRSRQNSMLQEMVGRDIFSSGMKESLNHDMATAMETLDAKLNYLIGVNMLNDANRSELKERSVNLSVTGTSFFTKKTYKKGDFIKTIMMLPSFPPTILELVGAVTWVKQQNSDKLLHIGVHFNYRCDEEENSIAKYVFRRHRENIRLRAKKEQQQSNRGT
ncbi:MAG: PilZ domain-containing protein [Ghiorsea sp.]|nr:PilZ domain-containing protein [Ghiorsea sp.]